MLLDERAGVGLHPDTHTPAEIHHLRVRHPELFGELVHPDVLRQTLVSLSSAPTGGASPGGQSFFHFWSYSFSHCGDGLGERQPARPFRRPSRGPGWRSGGRGAPRFDTRPEALEGPAVGAATPRPVEGPPPDRLVEAARRAEPCTTARRSPVDDRPAGAEHAPHQTPPGQGRPATHAGSMRAGMRHRVRRRHHRPLRSPALRPRRLSRPPRTAAG